MLNTHADADPLPAMITQSTATLYIGNVSEDIWSFILTMADAKVRKHEIDENALFSDREMLSFAGKDHVRMILPRPINKDFSEYCREVFGKKDIEVWVPAKHTGQTCLDTLADAKLLSKIQKFAKTTKKLQVISYSSSYQFLDLVQKLREMGISVVTPQSPEEPDVWTVNFYGSKSGVRQLAQQSGSQEPDFKMSYGIVSSGVTDTAKIAAKMYVKQGGVVLKINKGHSGAGMYIWREGDLPDTFSECQKAILDHLRKDLYWEKFPIVVEELVNINYALGGGSPSAEFKVLKNGEVKFLYYCGMRVTKDGVFKGVKIHKDVLPEKIVAQLTDTGFYIGEQYAAQGYRGYFDVDFVAAKNGQLLVTESNVRRTGGTHVYHLAQALFGPDFMYKTYTLSNNLHQLPNGSIKDFKQLKKKLEPVLFQKNTKEGVVIASVNLLAHHQIGYVVFGKNKVRALEIEAQMEALLQ